MKYRIKQIWGMILLLSIPTAFAQSTDASETIGRAFYKVFGYIFVDLGKLGLGDKFYEFFMRFMLFIVLFAVLFFAARFVFKEQKRIQITVGFVIALMSIILIPVEVLKWILMGYEIFTALFLLAFPVIGMIYLIHKVFGAPERHNYAIKAVLYYMLAMLIYNIGNVGIYYGFPSFDDWLGFAGGMAIILMIWNIIRAMFPPTEGEESVPDRFFPERSESRGERPAPSRGETPPRREPSRAREPEGAGPGRGRGPREPETPTRPGEPEGAGPGRGREPRRLGPPAPPNPPPPPPGDEGDDPTPPPSPEMVDPKDPPKPTDPKVKPKKIKPKKDERILIDNLWKWFLGIRNQDSLNACGAFAGTSMFEYIYNRIMGYLTPEAKISELFLWYYWRGNRSSNSGMTAHSVIDGLIKMGVCKYKFWTFEDIKSNKYLDEPGHDAQADAPRQRVMNWAALSNDPDDWIAVLAGGDPIFICADCPVNFDGGYTDAYFGKSAGYAPGGRGHAMVICGYDSHYPDGSRRNEAFRVRNSWGSGWATKGYVWVERNLLQEMVSKHSGAYIFTGWQKYLPKKFPARIQGRVIFDNKDIDPGRTGADYYLDDKIGTFDPEYKIGIIAQVKGTIYNVVDIPAQSPDGRFVLDFPWDADRFEPLTQLPERFPSLRHIDFKKQPAGVLVYKKDSEKEYYFHVVHFKDSMLGRGGEGLSNPENPRSDMVHEGIKFSGRPIVFSNEHKVEENVIIPVFLEEKKEEEKKLDDMVVKPEYGLKGVKNEILKVKAIEIMRNAIAIGPKLFRKIGIEGKMGLGVIQHDRKRQKGMAFEVMIKIENEGYIFMNPELMAVLNLKDNSEVTLEYGRDGNGKLHLSIGPVYTLSG